MKIKYSVHVSDQQHHNVEREVPGWAYEAILRGFDDVCDLAQLRYEQAVREAEERKRRELEAAPPAPEPARDDGQHKNVYEYDGAFKCMDCEKAWGALSGAPRTPPAECRFDQCASKLNPGCRCELEATHAGAHRKGKEAAKFVSWATEAQCCDGQNPEHVQCFDGNDPIGKLKAAGEDRS